MALTRQHVVRALLAGACSVPRVGTPIRRLTSNQLGWAEDAGIVDAADREAVWADCEADVLGGSLTALPVHWRHGDGSGFGDGSGGYGSGYGSGDGYGYGYGCGSGSGSGYGDGYGYGDGSVDGSGYGYGDGYGYVDGYGYGYGDGVGSGYGDGSVVGSGGGDSDAEWWERVVGILTADND